MVRIVLFVICILCFIADTTSQVLGGSMEYKSIGGTKYKLIARLYRDCRSVPLSSGLSFGVFAGTNGGNGCGAYSLSGFTRTSIKEISIYCDTDTPQCAPSNTNATGTGIEEHIYEATVDLTQSPLSNFYGKSSCCEITLYCAFSKRMSGTTFSCSSGCSFYTTVVLNQCNLSKCPVKTNSSPEMRNVPIQFLKCNQTALHSTGFVDQDPADSLTLRLVPAFGNLPNNPVSYSSPFSYNYFVTPYCIPVGTIKCAPNPKTSPPRGLYFDTFTGDIQFTPLNCSEVTVYVLEAIEWRQDSSGKWINIGKVRRDVTFWVDNAPDINKSPVITGPAMNKVCAGDKICFDIRATDETYTPYQTVPDTVEMFWDSAIPQAIFGVKNPSDREKTAQFCWQTHDSDARIPFYRFSVTASDNHCGNTVQSSMTFLVRVSKKARGSVLATPATCGTLYLEGMPEKDFTGNAKVNWVIKDSTGKVYFTGSRVKDTAYNLPGNRYFISMTINNTFGCPAVVYDTVTMPALSMVSLGSDTFTCYGNSMVVAPKAISFAPKPLQYVWQKGNIIDPADTLSSLEIKSITADTSVVLFLTDALGCVCRDTMVIHPLTLPKVAWVNHPLDASCHSQCSLFLENFVAFPKLSEIKKDNFRIYATNTDPQENSIVDSLAPDSHWLRFCKIDNAYSFPRQNVLRIWYRDSNGCENQDSSIHRVNDNPAVELFDMVYCQDLGCTNLDSCVSRPRSKFGNKREWSIVSAPVGNFSNLINCIGSDGNDCLLCFGNPDEDFYAGEYVLSLKVTDKITGCSGKDTCTYSIISEAKLDTVKRRIFCENTSDHDLLEIFLANNAKPSGAESSFKIAAFNGNTNSSSFGNTSIVNGHYLSANAKPGVWTIECTNTVTGCPTTANFDLEIAPVPVAQFTTTPQDSALQTNPVFQTTNTSSISPSSALQYQWYFEYPSTLNSSIVSEPQINYPAKDSFYTVLLIANSDKNCSDSFSRMLYVWSPSTGIRDMEKNPVVMDQKFRLAGVPFRHMETYVYDASGKQIAVHYQNRGVELPAGIYIYQIHLTLMDESQVVVSGKMAITE